MIAIVFEDYVKTRLMFREHSLNRRRTRQACHSPLFAYNLPTVSPILFAPPPSVWDSISSKER